MAHVKCTNCHHLYDFDFYNPVCPWCKAKNEIKSEEPLKSCKAGKDGQCYHKSCPQTRDNEPEKTGRHCPLDDGKDPHT